MSSSNKRNRVVFVGNIAFDVVEEQLMEIFKEAGPVINIRMVYDRDTGRPKGYGFIEYADANIASSAVRNLNGKTLNGRTLRVDFSVDEATAEKPGDTPMNPPHGAASMMMGMPSAAPGQPATDAITQLLSSMNANQLLDLLTQMKVMVQTNYDQARNILIQNPQLTYALFQAMIMMKVISPATVQNVLQNAMGQAQPAMPGMSGGYGAVPYPGSATAPPHPSQMYQQAPQSQIPQMPMGVPGMMNIPDQQQQALMQIMNLSDAQIDQLPYAQQQQIRQLKAQLMSSR